MSELNDFDSAASLWTEKELDECDYKLKQSTKDKLEHIDEDTLRKAVEYIRTRDDTKDKVEELIEKYNDAIFETYGVYLKDTLSDFIKEYEEIE